MTEQTSESTGISSQSAEIADTSADSTAEKNQIEFDIVLTPYPDRYVICADEIEKIDDTYRIKGDKLYGGEVIIDYRKKALLDYGAVMYVIHEGQELCTVTSSLEQRENYCFIKYWTNGIYEDTVVKPFQESRMDTVDPANCVGAFVYQNCFGRYAHLVLEEDFALTVPGDTIIYPYNYYVWNLCKSEEDAEPMTMTEYVWLFCSFSIGNFVNVTNNLNEYYIMLRTIDILFCFNKIKLDVEHAC